MNDNALECVSAPRASSSSEAKFQGINLLPGVSWQGHLGGAIGGALAAILLQTLRFHTDTLMRALALLSLPVVPAGFFLLVLWQAGWL